jgi:aspartyl protease family protein
MVVGARCQKMLKFAALAVVAAACAAGAAQAVVMLNRPDADAPQLRHSQPVAAAAVAQAAPADPTGGTGAEVIKSPDGHYWAEAVVDGERVRFLVDTGASAVALTVDDAKRLGFNPSGLDYNYKVMTAGGEARAAEVQLASVSVGGARVDDVKAMVIEKGLSSSLLGMTYLGRLSRFEATQTALILRP